MFNTRRSQDSIRYLLLLMLMIRRHFCHCCLFASLPLRYFDYLFYHDMATLFRAIAATRAITLLDGDSRHCC